MEDLPRACPRLSDLIVSFLGEFEMLLIFSFIFLACSVVFMPKGRS